MGTSLLGEIEEYWTNRAKGYAEVNREELAGIQHKNWSTLLNERIRNHFPDRRSEEIRVLDVGTGPGFFGIILTEMGYRVTAVDYTAAMLEEAKRNAGELAEKIEYRQMDAQDLAFEPESFDVVVSRNLTWNLEKPKQAYASWLRVLKKGGLLLNFDANWYGHLFDPDKRAAYEADREAVLESGMEDHYTCTDIDTMEAIAEQMPLSPILRPDWDLKILKELGAARVETERDMGGKVWSEVEQINYASTPMFRIEAHKA